MHPIVFCIDCDFVVNSLSCNPIGSGQPLFPSPNSPRERSLCKWECTWSRRESPHKREIGPNVSSARGQKSTREKKREGKREARAVRSCEVIYIQTDFQLSGVRTNENSRRHRRKEGTGEDRAWSGFIFGFACLVAVCCPSSLIPFSRLSRPVARLLPRSVTRFSLPLPRSYLPGGNHVPHECFTQKYAWRRADRRHVWSVRGPPQRPRALRVVWSRLIRSPSCQFDSAKSSGHI